MINNSTTTIGPHQNPHLFVTPPQAPRSNLSSLIRVSLFTSRLPPLFNRLVPLQATNSQRSKIKASSVVQAAAAAAAAAVLVLVLVLVLAPDPEGQAVQARSPRSPCGGTATVVAVIAAAAAVAAVVVAAGRAAGGPFEWTREDIEHCLIRTLVSGMRWLMADISSSGAALAIGRRHEAPSCSCSRTPCGPAIPPLQYHCRTMGDSNATMNNATTS